jgi:hypothetical protein
MKLTVTVSPYTEFTLIYNERSVLNTIYDYVDNV